MRIRLYGGVRGRRRKPPPTRSAGDINTVAWIWKFGVNDHWSTLYCINHIDRDLCEEKRYDTFGKNRFNQHMGDR